MPKNCGLKTNLNNNLSKPKNMETKETKEKITPEAQSQYAEIMLAIGTTRTQKYYLPNNHIAEAIAKGIGDDLPYLIKELKGIDPQKLWKQKTK